jgi:glycosyltransferase involved in cell wall biosynthesis
MSNRRIAVVAPALINGGGVPAVASFLYKIILQSGRYDPELISLATSTSDKTSVRLLSPSSWRSGPRVANGTWEGNPFRHVGAFFTEFEFQRYRPRRILTELLNKFDLIQVVAGTPSIALAVSRVEKPVCLFVATTSNKERSSLFAQERGVKKSWLFGMTYINSIVERRALPMMSHVFAESNYTKQLLHQMVPSERLSVAVPGVDINLFYPGTYRPNGYILSVGRFSDPRKNVRLLFEAYYRLRQSMPDAPRLMLVGHSLPSQEDWELTISLGISDYIDLNEDATVEELAEIYRNAALFVLPSNEEGLGVVILEAMASGIPVISTDCGGPATVVIDGETGCLIGVGDVEAMALQMRRLLVDASLRRRMCEAGRRLVEENFSLKAAGEAYLGKYDELTAKAI